MYTQLSLMWQVTHQRLPLVPGLTEFISHRLQPPQKQGSPVETFLIQSTPSAVAVTLSGGGRGSPHKSFI